MNMKIMTILLFAIFVSVSLQGQNYLFDKGKNGFSGGFGLFSEQIKTVDAYAIHFEYTVNGRFTLGFNRTFLSNEEGVSNGSASYCIIKRQNARGGLNVPIIIAISGLENTVFSYGVGLSFINRTHESVKIAPAFSILRTVLPSTFYSNNNSFIAIGFELNVIINKFRITPNLSLSQQDVLFGLDAGFLFQK